MSQIIKVFTGLFMVLYMMMVAIGLIGVFFEVLYAQNLHAAIVDELENSNYARCVIEECFMVTEQVDYELEIKLYPRHDSVIHIKSREEIPFNLQDIHMAKVELEYPLEFDFLGINSEQKLFGYAR